MLDADDYGLIRLTMVELTTSSASLDRSPGKNWVENAGSLPPYIRKLARAIEKDGHSLSEAIAIAIGRVKDWARGGGDVDADTQAKAAKAVAQWEKLKAKNKAKQIVKMSRQDDSEYLMLSNVSSFNTEIVRTAWNAQESERRRAKRASRKGSDDYSSPFESDYTYIRELWTNFIIVECEVPGGPKYEKIPYTVSQNEVTFGDRTPVELSWKASKEELSDTEKSLLSKNILVAK